MKLFPEWVKYLRINYEPANGSVAEHFVAGIRYDGVCIAAISGDTPTEAIEFLDGYVEHVMTMLESTPDEQLAPPMLAAKRFFEKHFTRTVTPCEP